MTGERGPKAGDPRSRTSGSKGGKASKGGGRPGSKKANEVVPLQGAEITLAEVPDPPDKLLRRTRDIWFGLFESGIAQAFQESDLQALSRWIEYVDEWWRTRDAVKREDRLVPGSMGQPVLNPLLGYLRQLEKDIKALEYSLGLTPMARIRLGVTAAEGQMLHQQLNQAFKQTERRRKEAEQEETIIEVWDVEEKPDAE